MRSMHSSPGIPRSGAGQTHRYTSPAHAAARWFAQRILLKPLVWSLIGVRVRGRANVDGLQAPFIVVANHSSHLDAPLVMGALPSRLTRHLAAGAAADYFFDVWWRKGLTALFFNAFPIERTGLRGRPNMAPALLSDGVPLLLFPEGTRSSDGTIARFKAGAAALCLSADVPCVPIALVGASEAMPRDRSWPVRGRPPVEVVIGEPIHPEKGESVRPLGQRIETRVRELYGGHA